MRRPRPIRWFQTHPWITDIAFTLLLLIPTVISSQTEQAPELDFGPPTWWRTLLSIGTIVPLVVRRRQPFVSFAAVAAFQIACDFTNTIGAGAVGVIVAGYSVAAHAKPSQRTAVFWLACAAVVGLFVVGFINGEPAVGEMFAGGVALVGAFAIGENIRGRRERLVNLAERAERAEREQEMLAHQRVAEERTRIARELHDVVAHSVSMMTIQAAAARRQLHRNPDQAETALHTIETTGRSAMDEMRRILGALRGEGAEDNYAPQPSLAMLPDLIAADDSLPITVDITGDFAAIPASTQLAAYRLVQEALTNVRRHAGVIRTVNVVARAEAANLFIEVADDGRGASVTPNGQGFGLIGMRERVAIANGTLEAGPRPGGGWRVAATFTLAGVPS